MIRARWSLASVSALTLAALLAGGDAAIASPYYAVKELGRPVPNGGPVYRESGSGAEKTIQVVSTGETIPFPVADDDAFASIDRQALPTRQGAQLVWNGNGYNHNPVTFDMRVNDANANGTVVGTFPHDGRIRSAPWTDFDYFYAQKQQDGTYGEAHYLGNNVFGDSPYNAGGTPHDVHAPSFQLNALDQILVNQIALFDINRGTATNLIDLLSPEDRAEYLGIAGDITPEIRASYRGIYDTQLSDDGSILLNAETSRGRVFLLLTPPTPTPEPSTLALLVVVGAGVAWRRYRRGCSGLPGNPP